MKIGIITFHSAANHGAALQAYALQTHLQQMGHNPFFINYQKGVRPPKGIKSLIGSNIHNTLHKIGHRLKKLPFQEFHKNFLNIHPQIYLNNSQLQSSPPDADAYICGSDQIWNPNQIKLLKDEQAFWLNFGQKNILRIAYAASFGTSSQINSSTLKRFHSYAKKFNAIGIRENNGFDILCDANISNIEWTPDPTFLLNPDDYSNILNINSSRKGRYLFSYQIEGNKEKIRNHQKINDFICNKFNLKLYESLSLSFFYNILYRRHIGPGQWLNKLINSSLVITNSFHAVVFSLIFHKPFIVILRTGELSGLNYRISSLLDILELPNRTIENFDPVRIKKIYENNINWEYVDNKLRDFKIIGNDFLSKYLM